MDLGRLQQLLAPFARTLDAAHRTDHAARVRERACGWIESESLHDAELALVQTLALLLPFRASLQQTATRAAVEAVFVEAGWSAIKIRELFRALERLPDAPKSLEEKLVADADTIDRLGLIGLVRAMASAGASGQELGEALASLRKVLARRLYTPYGHRDATAAREALRGLLREIESAFAQK
ncbi:MAG: hypothetical protein AAB426_12215 [Myxococcota bacterium]